LLLLNKYLLFMLFKWVGEYKKKSIFFCIHNLISMFFFM
jgi:hypothetical protein